MAAPLACYVHIPWCRHVCPYCDFNVYAASHPPEHTYTSLLVRELQTYAERSPWAGRTLESVYLGGGTPSLFTAAAVARILDAARAAFGLADGCEVTLEANPGTLSGAALDGYRAAGVNRLSLGAQSFDAAVLRRLGRDHAPGEIASSVATARRAGFDNVGLDLIFAVPGETLAQWEADLAGALALTPEHVSTYCLTVEPGTPFHVWHTQGRLERLDPDAEAEMADTAERTLEAAGYGRYEISSYARPGFASRHNQRYWDGSEYLGLGAGAHGFSREPAPGLRWTNARAPDAYRAAVAAGGMGVAATEHLSDAQARGELAWTGLRRLAGVDERTFHARFGVSLTTAFPHVTRLVADGLLERTAGRLRLTRRGLAFADTVAASFV